MRAEDRAAVIEMMHALWHDFDDDDSELERGNVFVWERESGGLGGFATYSLRPFADGCASRPIPYLEGWYVAPDLRRSGVGRALVVAVEDWAKAGGYREMASDALLENDVSLKAHASLGFEAVERIQHYRKAL